MSDGYSVHEADPFYVQALAEHRELHTTIERIRRLLDSRDDGGDVRQKAINATYAVARLRDQVRRHFAQEELGGYLEEAIARLPTIAPQAQVLQRQHGRLLETADRLLKAAETAPSADGLLSQLKTDFDSFADRLEAHENAENVLLQRAFNEDPGLEP